MILKNIKIKKRSAFAFVMYFCRLDALTSALFGPSQRAHIRTDVPKLSSSPLKKKKVCNKQCCILKISGKNSQGLRVELPYFSLFLRGSCYNPTLAPTRIKISQNFMGGIIKS